MRLLGLIVLICSLLFSGLVFAASVDHPLLRILVRKGILTEEEAQEVLQELAREEERARQEEKKEIVSEAVAQAKKEALPPALQRIKLGTLTYVDYSVGKEGDEDRSRFEITRGYLNFKAEITPWLSFRLTPDVHREAGGDLNVRIKYAYAGLKLPDLGFLTNVKSEIGQGHFPWLDFEEHLNPYRCQGTMPRERAGTFNSADVGIGVMGYFGGKLPQDYLKALTRHYPLYDHYAGRFGSWHFGIYNGSGYHEKEANNNKALEGRITLRPLGHLNSSWRGLQLSYFFIRGKGNRTAGEVLGSALTDPARANNYPDYDVDLFMVSFQHPWFVVTAQYSTSSGNNKGTWVRPDGRALDTELWSVFGDVTLPWFQEKVHFMARYDWFDPDADDVWTNGEGDDEYQLYMFGLAYYFYGKNMFLLDAEWVDYEKNNAGGSWGKPGGALPRLGANPKDDFRLQGVLQISF